ncbi:MAG: RHS repeat-associated core domain-containing protein [Polyangiales bacterium]
MWTFDESPTTSVSTDPLGHATTRGVNGYGVATVSGFADMTSVVTTLGGQTPVDESYPEALTDEAGRVRDWSYDGTGMLSGATELGAAVPWGYAYEMHLGGEVRWDLGSGAVTLGHAEGQAGADMYAGGNPDVPEVPELQGDSWRRQLHTFTSPEGEVTQRDYTAQGQLAEVTLPWGGSTGLVYGADGEVDTQTLASGETVTFTHDAAGRLLTRTASGADFATFAYGAGDRVTSTTDATGTTSYAYDTAGRHTGLTYPSGGRVRYEHDTEQRVTAVVAEPVAGGPEARRTEYTYDETGNVLTLTDPTGGVTEYAYDDAGRRTERRYPNGVTTTWTYDVRDRIASVTHTRESDGVVLLARAYERGATGEPTRITHEDGSYVALTYDASLRIASETYHAANDAVLSEVSYTYDQDGNRLTRTVDGEQESYTYASGSRLTSVSVGGVPSQTFTYDDGGRVTSLRRAGQNLDLTWDSMDHVVGVTDVDTTDEVQWHFDASGRRTGRDAGVSAQRYLVAPNAGQGLESPQLVTDGLGNTQVGYVFEGEHPIARYDAVGVPEYYLEDGIRSVVGVVDDAGGVVETYAYDSFGVARGGAEPDGFGFQGMWRDEDGTYFVRARVYDARTGRFLSRDPASGDVHDPKSLWRYAFANDNPLLFSDPTGLFSMTDAGATLAGVLNLASTALVSFAKTVAFVGSAACVGSALAGSGPCAEDGHCMARYYREVGMCQAWYELPVPEPEGYGVCMGTAAERLAACRASRPYEPDLYMP